MKTTNKIILIFFVVVLSFIISDQAALTQEIIGPHEIRWIRIGKLHNWFSNAGTEVEYGRRGRASFEPFDQADQLYWDAQYSKQDRGCAKALWIGTTNFTDPVTEITLPYKTVIAGPRYANTLMNFMPFEFKTVGRFAAPLVIVNNVIATNNNYLDIVDEIDPDIKADRIIINKLHSNMGITTTRKILKFSQQNHDDYFIYDYVFKNTGIIDLQNTQHQKTLTDVYFHFQFRYSPAFESYMRGFNTTSSIVWGRNTVSDVVGQDPNDPSIEMRAFYSYYSPSAMAPSYDDDWGSPNRLSGGALGAPAFMGVVTLHADTSPGDHTDDLYQPSSTPVIGADQEMFESYSLNDTSFMAERYELISTGHPEQTHAEAVGEGFADNWGTNDGGYFQTLSFGPYTLNPGDSIHIVMAEAVNGLSREKSIEVGDNWFNNSTPFQLPDGSLTSDRDEYKKTWVWTAKDSLFRTFKGALENFDNGYQISQPPPPPDEFQVTSSIDRIKLTWSDNPESHYNFDGYQIFRAVNRPDTTYEKIFSCDKGNSVNEFEDVNVIHGLDYYYYIQTKDDGSTNDVRPGVPLLSCKFYTMTSVPVFMIDSSTLSHY